MTLAPTGRASPARLWRGLCDECIATIEIVRHTSATFWLFLLLMFVPLSLVGLLPLGRLALVLQAIALLFFGMLMLGAGIIARQARVDDDLGLRDREGAGVVTYLPALIELAALPWFVVGQTILFKLVMEQVPGALPGTGWADAWLVSLNNLLFSEIFFDVIDVFRLGLAPEPTHRLGQVLIFVTRAILSIAFIRVVVQLFRAAYFRALGLGRGVDLLAALRTAASERDLAEVRHVGTALSAGLDETIATLVTRVRTGHDADALHGLVALREWAIPWLEQESGKPESPAGEPLLDELRKASDDLEPAGGAFRPARALLPLAALALGLAAAFLLQAWLGLVAGVAVLAWLGYWLVEPRRSLERCMDAGIVPACQPDRLAATTLLWSGGLALALVLTALVTFGAAARVSPTVFGATLAPGPAAVAEFVASNLLRLQVFLSAPDIFAIGVPALEHQPFLGSALTLLFRSALNLGLVAVVLTALGTSYTRLVSGSQLVANADLALRIEALRGGRFGPALAQHHAGLVQQELWDLLTEASDAGTRQALAADRLYDWRMAAPVPTALGEQLAAASVAASLAERGWREPAIRLLRATGPDARPPHPFPAMQVAYRIDRGIAWRRLGLDDAAAREFGRAEVILRDGTEAMTAGERDELEVALRRASAGGDGLEQPLELRSGLADGGPARAAEPDPAAEGADEGPDEGEGS